MTNRAFKEHKCFRCLALGHLKIHYRDPIRCFKWLKFGHPAGRCDQAIKEPPKHIPKAPQKKPNTLKHTKHTYAQSLKEPAIHKEKEKERNMVEELLNERPEEEDVFLLPMADLNETNTY